MRFVEILVVLLLVALAIWLLLRPRPDARTGEWEVSTRTREDGTLVVGVRGPGGERVVRELPPALEGPELTAELRLAREEAEAQVAELNRGPARLGGGR